MDKAYKPAHALLCDGTVAQRDVKYRRPLSALMPAAADYLALGHDLEG